MAIANWGNEVRMFIGDQEVFTTQPITINRVNHDVEYIGPRDKTFNWWSDDFSASFTLKPEIKDHKEISSETLDKLFKAVRLKKHLVNEDYSALLEQEELF